MKTLIFILFSTAASMAQTLTTDTTSTKLSKNTLSLRTGTLSIYKSDSTKCKVCKAVLQKYDALVIIKCNEPAEFVCAWFAHLYCMPSRKSKAAFR